MGNQIKFGPATASRNGDPKELIKFLRESLEFSDEAVELSLTRIEKIGDSITDEAISLLSRFKYKSIHLPVLNKNEFINYPDKSIEKQLKIIDGIIEKIPIDTVLIHPNQVEDFEWVVSRYGSLLAFENMDIQKNFRSVKEMTELFKKYPTAKWVFDVNHVYTIDQTMNLANDFFNALNKKLTHYHLSGYGGFHDALSISQEDIILKGIKTLNFPIIDEGNLLEKNILEKEYNYVLERLLNQFPA